MSAARVMVFTDMATGERFVIHRDPMTDPETWITADGQEIPVAEMEHTHIERVIMFLRLRAGRLHRLAIRREFEIMATPFGPGGDAASDAFDQYLDWLYNVNPVEWLEDTPIVKALKAELVRRYEPWGVAR